MTWKQTITQNRRAASLGAALTVVVGVAAVFGPWQGLTRLSYDLPFALRPSVPVNEAVIVCMDEKSHLELAQSLDGMWDRALHAELLKKLTRASAKAVVFDILFADPANPQTDRALVDAMALHGRVIVGSVLEAAGVPGAPFRSFAVRFPTESIRSVARVGSVMSQLDSDGVIRRLPHSTEHGLSLAEATAEVVGALPVKPEEHAERWLNYYGPPGTVPFVSYSDVLTRKVPSSVFTGKVVFVGIGQNVTPHVPEVRMDTFPTPYGRWGNANSPGVQIQATAFLNLVRGDWLTQLGPGFQALIVVACGMAFGFGLCLVRPWQAAGLALAASAIVAAAALGLVWKAHIWFAWLPICSVQIPLALGWAIVSHRRRIHREHAHKMIRAQPGLRHSLGEEDAQLVLRAAEQAKGLGLSASQLEAPQVKEAVIVRFPQGTSKPALDVLLDRSSGEMIQVSIAPTAPKSKE